ncbi:hypothetical protein AB0H76_11545 [Nocardia sp. NPDC050712]|uniref:hypothetical protein n=1 Tax=Nocardia sp. NPDC050712 TaxID=3155518 RepID=UPI0033C184A9
MSVHMIEDLVEESIRVLHDSAPAGDRRVRESIAALFGFQAGYDCSFTHFRIMDILLERGYTARFAVAEHPEYRSRRAFFDNVTEFTALAESEHAWLDQGYLDPPYFFCDAGTTAWRTMFPEETPPDRIPLPEVVHATALAAERAGNVELIALWHALGYQALTGSWVGEPREVPAVTAIRDLAHRTGAAAHDLPDGYRPPPEFYDDDPVESWWYALG